MRSCDLDRWKLVRVAMVSEALASRGLLVGLLAGLAVGAPSARADGLIGRLDARDVAGGPLDLTRVAFGQDGALMLLELSTGGDWNPADLAEAAGRTLCVRLTSGTRSRPQLARVCVAAREAAPVLRYGRLDSDGLPLPDRPMSASVSRPNGHSLVATFDPAEAGLDVGPYSWRLESSWTDASVCAQPEPCVDFAPSSASIVTRIADPPAPDQLAVLKPLEDARGAVGGVLDLTGVMFGQRGADMVLQFVAARGFSSRELSGAAQRALCVRLSYGALEAPQGRVCVTDRYGKPALRYARLDATGQELDARLIGAHVGRPARRSLWAAFSPKAAGLKPGWYAWQAESSSSGGPECAPLPACVDRVPDAGDVVGRIAPQPPRCFGAAARDPRHRCRNPRLALSVVPKPDDALIEPNAPCTPIEQARLLLICRFGLDPGARTVALIGDSHAEHWRAAVEVMAEAKGWRGVSITRASCPFTKAVIDVPEPARSRCVRWNREVLRWLDKHPSVRTVVVSEHAYGGVIGRNGQSPLSTQVAGYIDAWKAFPRSVRRVIVVRDPPERTLNTPSCVQRAIARRRRPGRACAVPRARVLLPDRAVVAATQLRSSRVRVIDLTRFMCSQRLCFPVVGGALVHKDGHHLTAVFARTLGPFLLREFDRLTSRRR
jgi:hypothetical protein